MRGFIIGLVIGIGLAVAAYEKGVLVVGSPGMVNWQILRSVIPIK